MSKKHKKSTDRSYRRSSNVGSVSKSLSSATCALQNTSDEGVDPCLTRMTNEFKKTFITQLMTFHQDAAALSHGKVANTDGWKDKIFEFGIGAGAVGLGAIIAALGAIGIIGFALTSGIGVAVAVVGIAIGVGYSVYKAKRDKRQFRRADVLMQRDTLEDDFEQIADLLSSMYAAQLVQCTPKDAANLAKSCVKAITDNMLTNKIMQFNELLHPVLLQGILMKSVGNIPKKELQLTTENSKKINTHDVISRAGLYCAENDRFYSSPSSNPNKYGTLFFSTKAEIKEYKNIVAGLHKHPQKWKYTKMPPSQADMLKNDAFFQAQTSKKAEVVESDEQSSSLGLKGLKYSS